MSRSRVSFRVALAMSALALLGFAAAATAAGYYTESCREHTDLDHRLVAAAAYVSHRAAYLEHRMTPAETSRWEQALTRKLAALRLGASLEILSPTSKRALYPGHELRLITKPARRSAGRPPATRQSSPAGARTRPPTRPAKRAASAAPGERPAATYVFPFRSQPDRALTLDLYAKPPGQNPRLLTALVSGLAALLAGLTLLAWAASRWLVVPLRRLSAQVDAIAGGEPVQAPVISPIREADNVAAAVAGMAARLAHAAEDDARLEARRRLLVSSIAHDLRTPLFSLRGYLDAIAAGIGDPGERLGRAQSKARQIDRLVTSLFDYARAEIDDRPSLQMMNLADAVMDAAAGFEAAADEREVKLQVTAHSHPSVRIDPDGFDRALANVIDNALRHTPPGGTVNVACGEDALSAFVRVADDGPGIAPDLLPRVFEPMVRASDSRRSDRAGLGLAIAVRLLRNQEATIDAANAPERGAIFTLRLRRTVP